jgi:hypothetical protein
MPSVVPPRREPEFVPWLNNLHTRVVADAAHFGVPSAMMTSWTAAYTAYTAAYDIATDPGTRTKAAIQGKASARDQVLEVTYGVMRVIQGNLSVTDEQRVLLGLPVRDQEPSPIPVPTESPVVEVVSMNGWTANIRLMATGTERRGKPDGVGGANIYSFVGATPPSDVLEWDFQGDTTRAVAEVEFPATLAAGTKVWITTCWKNPRFQTGPASEPVSLLIGGGVTSIAA